MNFELEPLTEAGRRFVELADEHAADFATRADEHDREGSFPFENFEAMRESGFLAATVPERFGGLGVDKLHDFGVGICRLSRGDGSTGIAANMHLSAAWIVTRLSGDAAAANPLLEQIGAGKLITAGVNSEAGTDLRHPLTEAVETDDGWKLNGRKIFGTVSPVANLFFMNVRVRRSNGDAIGTAFVPRDAPGLEIQDNWDALGMRASGSNDVVLNDCLIPKGSLLPAGPWGTWSGGAIEIGLAANATLVCAFLGIAEAAQMHTIDLVKGRRKGPTNKMLAERYSIQRLIAENEIDIAGARAMLSRTLSTIDSYFAEHPSGQTDEGELNQLMKDRQCSKWFVNRKAVEVVDRALTASGGSGYLSKSPLSRLYRDARAGSFMQPFSPNEAFEYIGKITLGLDPDIDR